MQVLYRTEIAWTVKALTDTANQLKRVSEAEETSDIKRGACRLRAEQLQSIAARLTAAVTNGDKRLAIR